VSARCSVTRRFVNEDALAFRDLGVLGVLTSSEYIKGSFVSSFPPPHPLDEL
jgi:hypothetical protein